MIKWWLILLNASLLMTRSTNSNHALPQESRAALQNLGLRLRVQRLARNMTLEQMAERLLCSPTTCRALESGKPTVNLGLLVHAFERAGDRHGCFRKAARQAVGFHDSDGGLHLSRAGNTATKPNDS